MPFTGSHPAAVLPLLRLGFVPSALVIGSMTPDLPYFVPLPVSAGLTHSAVGVVTVDLVLGFACWALWQGLLAPAAVAVAPTGVRRRLPPWLPPGLRRSLLPVRRALLAVLSIAVGAATHAFWDSFTHEDRWGVRQVGWLQTQHGPLAGHRYAQYASGLLGAVALALWVRAWWRRTPESSDGALHVPAVSQGAAVASYAAVALAIAVGGYAGAYEPLHLEVPQLRRAAFLAATWGGAAGGAMAIALAVSFAMTRRRTWRATRHEG